MEAIGYVERDRREDAGEGDKWSERQKRHEPKINDLLVVYKFEMLFSYTEPDGAKLNNWYSGVVTSMKNEKNEMCGGDMESCVSW